MTTRSVKQLFVLVTAACITVTAQTARRRETDLYPFCKQRGTNKR